MVSASSESRVILPFRGILARLGSFPGAAQLAGLDTAWSRVLAVFHEGHLVLRGDSQLNGQRSSKRIKK
jgi:hypothetical protein